MKDNFGSRIFHQEQNKRLTWEIQFLKIFV